MEISVPTNDHADLARIIAEAIATRFTPAIKENPDHRRCREEDCDIPDVVEVPMDERVTHSCMTTFRASDGYLSIRALTINEVSDIAAEAINAYILRAPDGALPTVTSNK